MFRKGLKFKFKKTVPVKGTYCLNCNRSLEGDENFCPNCGQKNDSRPLSVKIFISNFFSNFFNLDGKIWRSILGLIRHPGQVALDYISGKRVRYSNPFKFLLQISILFFYK